MTNFVLVHGAWQGAWAWDRVIEKMRSGANAQGIDQILAPDLPGHGLRHADEIRRITVEHYIQAVVTLVQVNRLVDIVLVGHGFAATFLPQVALQLGETVKHIVFIAGELPLEGKSAYDRLSSWDKTMLKVFKAEEKGFKFPDLILQRKLCNGLDKGSTADVMARLVPEPLQPWRAPVYRAEFSGKYPTSYVVLSKDKAISPGLQRRYSRSLNPVTIEEIHAGHGALYSLPEEVAGLLVKHADHT